MPNIDVQWLDSEHTTIHITLGWCWLAEHLASALQTANKMIDTASGTVDFVLSLDADHDFTPPGMIPTLTKAHRSPHPRAGVYVHVIPCHHRYQTQEFHMLRQLNAGAASYHYRVETLDEAKKLLQEHAAELPPDAGP